MRHTHSQRLENWLGAQAVNQLSASMRDFYWPIAVHGVPGAVYAMPGGDFTGHCAAGQFGSRLDRADDLLWKMRRKLQARVARGMRVRHGTLHTGFASLSDLIAEATAGKKNEIAFIKTGTVTAGAGSHESAWNMVGTPAQGTAGSAAPGGRATNASTVGAIQGLQNVSPDTRHIVNADASCNALAQMLLYDRLFDVAKTMNSTATEAVTGVPTRYQSITLGDEDHAGGNFLFIETFTGLPATAHNWTVCTYTDQSGNAGAVLPSVTGISSSQTNRLDQPLSMWFVPLASGDYGVKSLTQMQASALVATGVINFVIGHPIAWMPCPIAALVCSFDYLNTAFNLTRIFDDACLQLIWNRGTTSVTICTGKICTVHG